MAKMVICLLCAFAIIGISLLSYILGETVVLLSIGSGPLGVFCWGLLPAFAVSGIIFFLFGVVTSPGAGQMFAAHPRLVRVSVGLFIFALTMIGPARALKNGYAEAADLRNMSQPVAAFGLEHFAEIDVNNDGLIIDKELDDVQTSHFSAEQATLLTHMHQQIDGIGHTISSRIVHGGDITLIFNTYAINKEDLQTYPKRVAQKYRKW